MVFFLLAALLSLAVCAVLMRPLLRPAPALEGPAAYNAAIYREQLAELEADAGKAPPEGQADTARLEIQRRLLAAADSAPAPDAGLQPRAERTALALLAAGPIVAGILYLHLGAPEAAQGGTAGAMAGMAEGAGPGGGAVTSEDPMHAQMDDMVKALRSRLAQNPQDAEGWALLARTEVRLGRAQEAVAAYGRAHDLVGGSDRQLSAEYAEARVMAGGGVVDAIARNLFARLLDADSRDPQARYYLALARGQSGDLAGALADWRALLADTPPDAPWRETLERQIAAAEGAAGAGPAAGEPPAGTPAGRTAAPGPTTEEVAAAQGMNPEDRSAMIEGMVAGLAERLRTAPRDVDGWRRLARAYDVLGRTGEAEKAHQRVLALDPRDQSALWRLGQIAAARGDASGARRHWRKLEQALAAGSAERAQVRTALDQLTP